jgi:hypothetical protein
MPTAQMPTSQMPTDLARLDETDRTLAPLTREWFEHDLRRRIDAAMERQLAIFLAAERSRGELAEAA